jgi:hypothetical protein
MKHALVLFLSAFILVSATNTKSTAHLFDEATRKKITNDILNNLVKEDYEAVRKDFHSSLRTTLPVEKISEVWTSVVSQSGIYKKTLSTSVANVQGYNQVKLRIQFENENATLEATFTDDDKVIGLFIKP